MAGLLFVVVGLLWLAAWILTIWAVVDAIGHTKDDFLLISSDRTVWLVALIGFALACGPFGVIVAGWYLLKVRPQLQSANA